MKSNSRTQALSDGNHRMTEVQENTGITLAQKAIEEDRQARVKTCSEALRTLLEKYKCSLHSHQEFIDGQPKSSAQIIIVAQ